MSTTQGVRRRIETSLTRLHDSQYRMSKLSISLKDVVARPGAESERAFTNGVPDMAKSSV